MENTCPKCNQAMEIAAGEIGKTITCSGCGTEFKATNPRLTSCPDCFAEVSRRATVCPHCGAPLKGVSDASEGVDRSTETSVLLTHPSAWYFFWDFVIGIILLPTVIVGLPILLFTLIRVKCTDYEVTTHRVIVRTGWLNKKQTEIWIRDMRGVNLQRSLWERIAGTGTIFIGTAATAGAEIQMSGISKAQMVLDTINGLR